MKATCLMTAFSACMLVATRETPTEGPSPRFTAEAAVGRGSFDLSESVVLKIQLRNDGMDAVDLTPRLELDGLPFSLRVRRSDGRGGFENRQSRLTVAAERGFPWKGFHFHPGVAARSTSDHVIVLNRFYDMTTPGEYEVVVEVSYWTAGGGSHEERAASTALSPPIRFAVSPRLARSEPPGPEARSASGRDGVLEIETKAETTAVGEGPIPILVIVRNKSRRLVTLLAGRTVGTPRALVDAWRLEKSPDSPPHRGTISKPMGYGAPIEGGDAGWELRPSGRVDFIVHADLHRDIRPPSPYTGEPALYSIEVAVPYLILESPPGAGLVRADALTIAVGHPRRGEMIGGGGLGGGGLSQP